MQILAGLCTSLSLVAAVLSLWMSNDVQRATFFILMAIFLELADYHARK